MDYNDDDSDILSINGTTLTVTGSDVSRSVANRLADQLFNFSLGFPSNFKSPLRMERDLSPIGRLTSVLKKIKINPRESQDSTFFSHLTSSSPTETKYDTIISKLASSTPLTTAEAAIYYKDIDKLEDGKIKALTSSILAVPLLRNVNSSFASIEEDIFDKVSGDVIILGGYRGSILRDSHTKRRAWIPVLKAGLNIRKIDLLLGPTKDAEINVRNQFYPDGMLTNVGPVDISKKLIKRLSSNPNVTVHNWGYDWRLSLAITSSELYEFINDLYKRNGGKPVILIGHSMGGLVAHGAMVKNPQMIKGIIYAGTPFPCGNILGPLRFSDSILLSKTLISNEVNFMMRSSFVFVPRKELGLFRDSETGDFICEEDGSPLDYWKPQTWVRWNSSPLVAGTRWRMDNRHELAIIREALDKEFLDNNNNNNHHHSNKREFVNLYEGISNYDGTNEKVQHLIAYLRATLPKGLDLKDVLPEMGVDIDTERIVRHQIRTQAKLNITFNEAYEYLSTTLKETNDFINTLKYNPQMEYPKMVQLYSISLPSVKFCLVDGPESVRRGDYYNFFYAEGDGVGYHGWLFPRVRNLVEHQREPINTKTVPYEYSQEELEGFGYDDQWAFNITKRVRCEGGHISLLTDLDAIAEALQVIIN